MKHIINIFCVVLFVFLSACDEDGSSDGTIHGSGNIIQITRDIPDFKSITMEGSGNLYISQTGSEKLIVRTDDNIQEEIRTTVSGKDLLLTTSGKSISPTVLDYIIEVKDLASVSIIGAGNLECPILEQDEFSLNIEGAGNIDIDSVKSNDIELRITGGGTIGMKGETEKLSANIEGAGYINCDSLISKDVVVVITGTGDVKVYATDNLSATITGAGRVFYRGDPEVVSNVTGVGEVKKIEE